MSRIEEVVAVEAEPVEVELALDAHPRSAQQWHLTDEAISVLVAGIKDKPVLVNYTGQPVGKVVGATMATGERRVLIQVEFVDASMAKLMTTPTRKFGPKLFKPDVPPNSIGGGEHWFGPDWKCDAIGVVDDRPRREESADDIMGAAAQAR
jgi:hypothetical protein